MTMVETMVLISMVALIGGGSLGILMGGLTGWSRGSSTSYADTSASLAAQKVAIEIRDGQLGSVASNRLTVTLPQETTGANQESCYNRGVSGQTRQYWLSGANLMRTVAGADSIVARGVSSATFSVSGPRVTIIIDGREQNGRYTTTKTVAIMVRLRNFNST